MELFILVLFAFLAALFVIAKWREARARKLQAGVWVLRTTLAPSTLHKLIVKGLKGRDQRCHYRRAPGCHADRRHRGGVRDQGLAGTPEVRRQRRDRGARLREAYPRAHCGDPARGPRRGTPERTGDDNLGPGGRLSLGGAAGHDMKDIPENAEILALVDQLQDTTAGEPATV